MHSESEALCKQCVEMPVLNYSFNLTNGGSGSYNGTLYTVSNPTMCIASRCMAWRWADDMKTTGYCGKAGKPY